MRKILFISLINGNQFKKVHKHIQVATLLARFLSFGAISVDPLNLQTRFVPFS